MNKLIKFILFFLSLSLVTSAGLFILNKKPSCKNCNIILISMDTLGSNHLPCYGYKRNTSPLLCKFAQENIQFTNSFSNASWTLPSHFSIFTGLYPKHHGVEKTVTDSLDNKIQTLTQVLQSNGYDTIYVGPVNDETLPLDKGLGKGFNKINNVFQNNVNSYNGLENWNTGLKKLKSNNSSGKKTFLFLHTYWVHSPYLVNDADPARSQRFSKKDVAGIPLTYPDFEKFSPDFYQYFITRLEKNSNLGFEEYNRLIQNLKKAPNLAAAKKIAHANLPFGEDMFNYYGEYYGKIITGLGQETYAGDLYDELIKNLDQRLNALILTLTTDERLAKNTIIVITSDHGEAFGEHGELTHNWDRLYNSTTSVPLIMYLPGYKKIKIDRLVESVDIMPTILDLTNIKVVENLDGITLIDSINNPTAYQPKKYLISQGHRVDSVRDDCWKLYINYINGGEKNIELYDLKSDPNEINNLSDKYTDISSDLYGSLNKIIY